MYAACSRVFSSRWRTTDAGHWSDLDLQSLEALQSTDRHTTNAFFCVLLVPRRIAGRASSSTSEGLLVGSVIVFANAVTCGRSTLSTQLGSETLNIHAICQLSTGIRWLVPRLYVALPFTLREIFLSGSLSSSLSLLKTYFFSRGSCTGSATEWPRL